MTQYNKIKNTYLPQPSGSIDLGSDSTRFDNLYLANNLALGNSTVTASDVGVPKISSLSYVGDDTAANVTGGQTITITGSGFKPSPAVYVGGVILSSVAFVNTTTVTFTSPVKTAGSYSLSLVNSDGGTAIYVPGIQYSGVPAWSTSAGSLANVYEYGSVNATVSATGDAPITYSVSSGSLPTGLTLGSANGVISGTTAAISSGSVTTNFYLNASDAQNQDTARNFSITVNADNVTWSSPSDNTSYTIANGTTISTISLSASSAAGKSITYSATNLPSGLSISGSTIVGTPTGAVTTSATITATAATTGKTATIILIFNMMAAPTWSTDSGNLGIEYTQRSGSFTPTATSATSYSLVSGSLPSGYSLNTTSGVLSGTATGVADYTSTTYNFTLRAVNSGGNVDRAFSIQIYSRYVGYACQTGSEGATLSDTAPGTYIFNRKDFSSYGTPDGSCGSFTYGGCNSGASNGWNPTPCKSYSQGFGNGDWGDPCGGTYKRSAVQLSYGPF